MKTVYQQIINGNAEGVGNIDQSGNAGVFCAFFNFGQKFTTAIDFRGLGFLGDIATLHSEITNTFSQSNIIDGHK